LPRSLEQVITRLETGQIEIALVAPVVPGDVLLVHAGTAIARLEDQP